jgi:hypothetical protein
MKQLLLFILALGLAFTPAEAINLFDPGIPSFPDGLPPTFNTTSFDLNGYRYVYSARSGAHGQILVNRQLLSSGAWTYNPSRVAVDMRLYDTNTNPHPSVAMGTVLRAPSAPNFFNPADNLRYPWLMYFIYQGTQTPDLAGVVCLAYSSDGINWTPPIYAIHQNTGGPRGTRCGVDSGSAFYVVRAEAIGGFMLSSASIHLWHLDGDLAYLEAWDGSTSASLTFYVKATADAPDILQRQGQITLNGVSNLNRPGGMYRNYFANLDATYDSATGKLYLFRVYPAPYDSNDPTTPCNHNLRTDFATLPTHGQVYEMLVNGDFSKSISAASSWTKTAEFGQFYGHTVLNGMLCQEYRVRGCIPNNEYLFNSGSRPNLNMVSVHKTPTGLLALDPQGLALLYFQTVDRNPPFMDVKLMAGWFTTVPGSSICSP